ncbi:MAG: thiamine-binding protein [Acidimicrobiia bacterium]|jgi:uncharacterized protein YqgV (UPF0045/DUF77 family)
MSNCRAEFLVEPFEEGAPGPHVRAAIDAVAALGLAPEIGPFGTTVVGERDQVIAALQAMLEAAATHGATRVSLQFTGE